MAVASRGWVTSGILRSPRTGTPRSSRTARAVGSSTCSIDLVVDLAPARLLDLGVGSGLVAERVLVRLPDVSLVGVDFSAVMLAEARTRLAPFEDRVDLVKADVSDPEAMGVPNGRGVRTAITVQALHNIDHQGQQRRSHLGARCART